MRVKLDKVCKRIYAGGDVPKDRYSTVKTAEYAIPIYANAEKDNGLYGYTDTARENELSITVAARGTIGFTAIRREPFLPVVRLITVVPDLSTVSERYLYYALRNCKPASSGTSIPQLTVPDIKKNEIELYSLSVQETIADKLDAVGRVIELRQQQLQTLDELVKARFVEMFGDYLKDDRRPLSEVAIITGGLTKNSNRNTFETKMPYLRVANVFYNRLDLREILEIGVKEEEIEKTLLQAGDLLFVEGNGSIEQIGRVAIWDGSIDPILHQNHLIKARFNNEIIAPEYALFYFMLQDGRQQIISKSVSTSGLNTLSVNKVSSLLLPIPPITLQKQFGEFIKQTDKSKVAVQKALDEAQLLFDSLMQKYFG